MGRISMGRTDPKIAVSTAAFLILGGPCCAAAAAAAGGFAAARSTAARLTGRPCGGFGFDRGRWQSSLPAAMCDSCRHLPGQRMN